MIQTPCERVLDLLEGVKRTKKGTMAKCPAHEDRSPSLLVSEGTNGACLLWCYAGCSSDDVRRALGLQWSDLFPSNDRRVRPNREKRRPVSSDVARVLYRRGAFPKEWAVARALACTPVEVATQDLESNKDYLERSGVDRHFIWKLSNDIRGVALLHFGNRKDPYKHLAGAVARLERAVGVVEADRKEVAA